MKKIIIITLSASALLFSSCSKNYLNTKPTDSITPESAITNVVGANLAMRGCYRELARQYFSSQNYNGEPNFAIADDMISNLVQRTLSGNGWFQDSYNPSSLSSQTSSVSSYRWQYGYWVLKSVNEVLARIDDIVAANAEEASLKAHIKAESLTLSAYLHYRLGDWYSNPYKAGQPNTQLAVPIKANVNYEIIPRSTIDEVYAFCIKNLTEAIALYEGDAKSTTRDEGYYLTKNAAYAIKARIHMIKGEWQLALDNAKLAMVGKTIFGPAAIKNPYWFSQAVSGQASETIWGSDITSKNAMNYYSFYMFIGTNNSTFTRTGPLSMWAPLAEAIPNTDIRKEFYVLDDKATIAANIKIDAGYYDSGAGTSFLSKSITGSFVPIPSATVAPYQSRKFRTSDKTTVSAGDFIMIRLAEMYYIAAEASYQLGDITGAQKYLTDANKPYDASFVAKTGTDLLKQIYDYKSFDLWGEGRGLEDMRRRGTTWDRTVAGSNANLNLGIVEKVNASNPADWKYIKVVVPRREITLSNGIIVPDPEI